jgi:hypothetical protein
MPGRDGPDAACAAERSRAEQITVEIPVEIKEEVPQPVAIYFILDQSASMLGLKWPAAVNAINAFLNDPRSAGLDVAFQYFSVSFLPPSGCSLCDGTDCKTPAFAMGKLPGAAQAISADLQNKGPAGIGTPIEAALRGGTQFCQGFQAQNPAEKCVFVLITDGAPLGCAGDAPTLAGIAGAAKAAGVTTYAIGMDGADFNLLDQIGQQGGGDCTPNAPSYACNAADAQSFSSALELIRTSVVVTHTEIHTEIQSKKLDCEFARPTPPDGKEFDKDQVNVNFTTAGQTSKILKARSAAECPAGGGWYYDDENNPQKILVCPATCAAIQAAPDADVAVLLGCATEQILE